MYQEKSKPNASTRYRLKWFHSTNPYGFWSTLIWGAVAGLAPFALVAFCYQHFLHGDRALSVAMFMLAQLGSIAVIALAIRLRGWSFTDYLRLKPPAQNDILLAIGSATALLLLQWMVAQLAGRGLKLFAPEYGTLFLLSTIVVSPVAEELSLRGFMYPGLARSWIGPWGAILLLAFVFSLGHESAYISHLCSGLLFGWLRQRSDSLTVPILGHATTNLGVLTIHLQGYGWIGF